MLYSRYGSEAGNFTDNTLYAVGQTAMAAHNAASLGVKGIAKRAAKDTGKALVYHYKTDDLEYGEEAMEEDKFIEKHKPDEDPENDKDGAGALPPKKPL